jgi:hypothetical protein
MIRNVLIMATSGLVLFSKAFTNSISQARLIGSLITAIIEFSQQTTGMGVCFIELSNVSITIVSSESAKIFCALFYDREEGVTFGRFICSEILNAFIHEYAADLGQVGRNLLDFHGFHATIVTAVQQSTKPILVNLESHASIKKAFLVHKREIIETHRNKSDQLVVLSSLNDILDIAGRTSMIFLLFSL